MKDCTASLFRNIQLPATWGSILIVDDDDGVRETLSDILVEEKYTVATASNGKEAIEYIKKQNVPMVIMDMKMPGLNGIETFDRIHEINHETRVIFSSAYMNGTTIPSTWKSSVVGILPKPIDVQSLLSIISKQIEKRMDE